VTRTLLVIPYRGSIGAKSRLSPIFSEHQRARLAVSMLRRTLSVVDASGVVAHTLIVTADPDHVRGQVAITERRSVLKQSPDRLGLNVALDLGREWAIAHGFTAMLVLPGDLPTISAADVRALTCGSVPVVVAPDRHRAGTNALLLHLRAKDAAGHRFVFSFGQHSARRHEAEASRLGLDAETLHLRGVAFDLDTPDDWRELPVAERGRLLAAMADVPESAPVTPQTLVALKGM
jgi:2-phospho-L-lactate/phosphoenolpyruvate guanylyltransferase